MSDIVLAELYSAELTSMRSFYCSSCIVDAFICSDFKADMVTVCVKCLSINVNMIIIPTPMRITMRTIEEIGRRILARLRTLYRQRLSRSWQQS